MTEVLFYQLRHQALDAALPGLLERCLERGWRVVVETGSTERAEALDAHLWTYRDDSFLPHGLNSGDFADDQPILLTTEPDNPNNAEVRFLVDGAPLAELDPYRRVVVMFSVADDETVAQARVWWKEAAGSGHEVSFWEQAENGAWTKRG